MIANPTGATVAALAAGWLLSTGANSWADDTRGWTTLFDGRPPGSWTQASDASLDPDNRRELVGPPGAGVLISSPIGPKADRNLQSSQAYRDFELRLEFMLGEGSNAGIKLHGLYEVQLYDSHGKAEPSATDCGGVYPRAVREPVYHHIDQGTPPLVNAAKPAGEWQTVFIRFRAPRFDKQGRKTTPAVLEEARINGEVVQHNVPVDQPTGAYWRQPELATGPIYLQGDHGPVAYRGVQVRELPGRVAAAE